MAKDVGMTQSPRVGGRQLRARLLLVVNILFCLMMLEVIDIAASEHNSALLLIAGALFVASLLPLVWLWGKARVDDDDRTNPAPAISPTHVRWMLLILLLVATAFRLYQLGTESFWYDEVSTAEWASQSLSRVLQTVNPLTYVITHVALEFGRSEFYLRLGSVLAGVLVVPAVYAAGRALYGQREGLVAAILLGTSVYAIFHSQEVRFYAWQMLFSTLTLYFLLQGLRHDRVRDWAGFTVFTVLNLYNHPFALLVLASEGLYTISVLAWDLVLSPDARETAAWSIRLQRLGHRLVGPGAAAAAALVLYTPQWRHLFGFYNPKWVGKSDAEAALTPLSSIYDWLTNPVVFWLHGLFGDFTYMRPYLLVFYLLLGLFLLGLVSSRGRAVFLTLLWTLLPLPLLAYVGIWINPRYMSYMVPVILIVIARAVTYLAEVLAPKNGQTAALLVLTGLAAAPSLLLLPNYYTEPQKDQWRELAAFVDAQHQTGDLILFNSVYPFDPLPFDWYSTTPAEDLIRQPFPEDYVLRYEVQLNELDGLTAGFERVWLSFYGTEPAIRAPIMDQLSTRFELDGEWSFRGLDLLLFTASSSGGAP
jgi:mannosyltransferase